MFFAPSKSRQRARVEIMGISKTRDYIEIRIKMPNSSQEPPVSSKATNQDFKDMMFFAPSKSRQRAKFWIIGKSKTSDHIQIKIKMLNPSQEPPVSSKAPNKVLRRWMFFAPSNSRQRAKNWIIGVSKTSDHIQIKIRMQNPTQGPPVFSNAPNQDLKDIDVLCTFKIKIES